MTLTSKNGQAWATQRSTLPRQWNLYSTARRERIGYIMTRDKKTIAAILEIVARAKG